MKSKITSVMLFNLITCVLIISQAAFADSSKILIGKWQMYKLVESGMEKKIAQKFDIEFSNDNTYNSNMMNTSKGKWIILDDDRIKMTMFKGDIIWGQIQGDSLIIRSLEGFELFYKK